jgi:hypothetical protein
MRHKRSRTFRAALRDLPRRTGFAGGSGRPGRTGRTAGTLLVCAGLAVLTAGASAAMRAARADIGPGTMSTTTAAPAVGGIPSLQAAATPDDVSERAGDHDGGTAPRPFDHERHEAVSCTACHGTGVNHRTLLVRDARDCAACHHRGTGTCVGCHATGRLPAPGTVVRELSLGVWPSARTRELPFGHALHATITCRECHRTPVTLAMDRPCGSCHESHHRPDADCAACHSPPQHPVHGAGVHLTCAGAGCHAAAVAPPPSLSRTLCIACHEQQRTHEPDGECASCHLIRPGPR